MSIKVKLDPTNKILTKRKLQKGGEAQIFFTKQCAKEMNDFVPFFTGRLKDMSVIIGIDYVKYSISYARKQYYTNSGKGIKNHSGLRGKVWDKKMWNNKGPAIVKNIANLIGGKVR